MNSITPSNNSSRSSEIESRLVRLAEIEPVFARNHLVKDWLTRGGLSMLYGPSNAGKTFVALDIAMHVAAGLPWRGFKVAGGPVLYIAAEGGAGVLNRLAALKRERPEMASAPFTLLPMALDLLGQGDALGLREILADTAPALVVVDTLARSMGDGDENTAKDASKFVKNCDLVRESTGAHVMVVHHTGKHEDNGARGSSAFRAAVDTEINVTSNGEIVCKKQRDMAYAEPLAFTLRSVTLGLDEDGEPVKSAVVEPSEPRKPERKRLSGQKAVAMQVLDDALGKYGINMEGSNYPPHQKVVHLDTWRAECDLRGLTKGPSDSARRTAFKRAKDNLIKLGVVHEYGDYFWRAQRDD